MDEQKHVFFVMETEITSAGEYIPLIATSGEPGFHRTDWTWGTDKEIAQSLCDERNKRAGISRREAMLIQLQSMRSPHYATIDRNDYSEDTK